MKPAFAPPLGISYPRTTDLGEFLRRSLPRTQAVYAYWDSKRRGRPLPSRQDIDPLEMRAWLAGIQLVDVHHRPRKLVYRLVGQVDVDFRGYNPTGRTVEECGVGQSLEESLRNYEIAITTRSFVYDFADYVSTSGLIRSQECVLLPLSEDGVEVNMVMTYAEVDLID